MTNENTEQTIEILEYAVKLAKAVNEVDADIVDDLLGFDPKEASPLDYVTAARMVYADKKLTDALKNAFNDNSPTVEDAWPSHLPDAPTTDEVRYLSRQYQDTADKVLGKFHGVRYFRNADDAILAANVSVSPFAGFWCPDCNMPHMIERTAE